MCSGSEAGSYSRLIDFVHHATLGLRVIKKKKVTKRDLRCWRGTSSSSLSLASLDLSDIKVDEP